MGNGLLRSLIKSEVYYDLKFSEPSEWIGNSCSVEYVPGTYPVCMWHALKEAQGCPWGLQGLKIWSSTAKDPNLATG